MQLHKNMHNLLSKKSIKVNTDQSTYSKLTTTNKIVVLRAQLSQLCYQCSAGLLLQYKPKRVGIGSEAARQNSGQKARKEPERRSRAWKRKTKREQSPCCEGTAHAGDERTPGGVSIWEETRTKAGAAHRRRHLAKETKRSHHRRNETGTQAHGQRAAGNGAIGWHSEACSRHPCTW